MMTVRTPVSGFGSSKLFADLKQGFADLAQDLLATLAIIEI